MSEWADFVGSAVGGGILSIVAWLTLSKPCRIAGTDLTYQCVELGDSQYGLGAVAFFMTTAGAIVGFLIHIVRS